MRSDPGSIPYKHNIFRDRSRVNVGPLFFPCKQGLNYFHDICLCYSNQNTFLNPWSWIFDGSQRFYRCKYCKQFTPVWNELAASVFNEGIMVKIAKVCTFDGLKALLLQSNLKYSVFKCSIAFNCHSSFLSHCWDNPSSIYQKESTLKLGSSLCKCRCSVGVSGMYQALNYEFLCSFLDLTFIFPITPFISS